MARRGRRFESVRGLLLLKAQPNGLFLACASGQLALQAPKNLSSALRELLVLQKHAATRSTSIAGRGPIVRPSERLPYRFGDSRPVRWRDSRPRDPTFTKSEQQAHVDDVPELAALALDL